MSNYIEADKESLTLLKQLELDLSTRLEKLNIDLSKSHSSDSAEQAVERENDDVINVLKSETQVELNQIRNAIKRIKEGSYQICSKCGGNIPPDRLRAVPYTNLCIECAASQEQQ